MQEQIGDRGAFAERLRLQVRSRYRGAEVSVDAAQFALHVTGAGIDTTLPLTPLYNACRREPARAAALIAGYVSSLERQMTPRSGNEPSLSRLLWCVRSRQSISGLTRASELMTMDVAADLVAFVAEELPASTMRGVSRDEMIAAGHPEDETRAVATRNTQARFAPLCDRIARLERVPADGWRIASEPLFQSSVLVVRDVLRAFVARAGSNVLMAAPDRAIVYAVPDTAEGVERFRRRVQREWREAMNPCSKHVLVTDGETLTELPKRQRTAAAMMPWLAD